jgi:hypothetical protein
MGWDSSFVRMTTWCGGQLDERTYYCNSKSHKVCTKQHEVLLIELIEAIKIDFGGFFMVGLGFFLRQNDNLVGTNFRINFPHDFCIFVF